MMDYTMFATEGITKSERFLRTPGGFAKENLVFAQEIGRLQSIQPHRCIREKLESYLIFVVLGGSGMIQIDGEEHPLVMGDCVFIDCQQHYEHQSSENDPWELMWVHCDGLHMKAFHAFFKQKNDEKEYITIENIEKLKGYFKELLLIQKDQGILAEFRTSILIEQIVEFLIEEALKQKENKLYVVYNQIREYINENYQKHALVEKMAKVFYLEADEMNQEFQKIFGIDIYGYILNRRFTKAKELLRFTIKPVSEIVEISGICNGDLFCELFEKYEKMTAEEYRMKWAHWVK